MQPEPSPVVSAAPSQQIWALGGGKGGIGKSFLAANIATVAARTGRRVLLIDADLGGANLHTFLGVRAAERVNLSDFLADRVRDLEKVTLDTPVPGLRLVAGAMGHTGAAGTSSMQRASLMQAIRRLPFDMVVLDLSAGSDLSTIDFFLQADEGLMVTTPEPTAVENGYAFLRAALYRRLALAMQNSSAYELVREAMDRRNERGMRTPSDLLQEIEERDAHEGDRARDVVAGFRPRLVVNQVRSSEEVKLGFSMQSVCRKYFGLEVEYIGYVSFDDCVWRSIQERRPLVLSHPESDGSLYVRRIAKKMLGG